MRTRGCVQRLSVIAGLLLFLVLISSGAACARLSATPASIYYGSQPVGSSYTVPVVLSNTDAARSFTIVSVYSTSAQFPISVPSLPATLAPGQTLTIPITFTPSSAQTFSGMLQITTYYGWTVLVPVTGVGIQASPQLSQPSQPSQAPQPGQTSQSTQPGAQASTLSASVAAVNFGVINLGSIGLQTMTLSNSGSGGIAISGISLSGSSLTFGGIYTGMELSPGQSTVVTVSFAPASAIPASGAITIISNAANSPLVIPWVANSNSNSSTRSASNPTPSSHSVMLTWSPSASAPVIGYNVYRGLVSGGPYSIVNSSPVATTAYSDTLQSAAQTVYYVVTTVGDNNAESAYSSEVAVPIP